MDAQKPFAEVIESSLSSWSAQCWDWDTMPTYGSLLIVRTPTRIIFGLVHEITTGSVDTNRTVFAYKKSEAELKRDHPHIFELIQTTFRCLTLGYIDQGKALYQMAPEPPKIHTFVTYPAREDLLKFFQSEQYLHTIFSHAAQIFSLDDVLLALLKHMAELGILSQERFARFIETFSLLTANDYRRLKLFLQRAQALIPDDRSRVSPAHRLESGF